MAEIPPDVQAQILALQGAGDKDALLRYQLQMSEALRGTPTQQRSTPMGALLSGLGGVARSAGGNIGGMMAQANMSRLGQQRQAGRQAFTSQLGAATTPEAQRRLGMLGLSTGDEVVGRTAGALIGSADSADARAAAEARAKAEAAHRNATLGLQRNELDLRRQELQAQRDAASKKVEREAAEKAQKNTDDLRKEFMSLPQTKRIVEVNEARQKVAAASPDGAGDLALIYGYMKLLDPGSTVKDQEFANAAKTEGIPGQILALRNQVFAEGMLPAPAREKIKREAETLYNSHLQTFKPTIDVFRDLAGSRGLELGMVVPELGLSAGPRRTINGKTYEAQGTNWVEVTP